MTTTLYTATSGNTKTGNMPQAWIGKDYDSSVKSCLASGCPLLPRRFGGQDGQIGKTKLKPCYAWQGSAKMAFSSMVRKLKRTKEQGKPNPYSLKNAITKSVRSARMIRVTAIGNAGEMSKEDREELITEAKKAGLGLLGYIAGFKKYPEWMGSLMASTYTLRMADVAIDKGWRASTVLPEDHKPQFFETPKGRKGIVCPAQYTGGAVDCNSCGLCVAEWDTEKQLKRLVYLELLDSSVLEELKGHFDNLIVGFISHR